MGGRHANTRRTCIQRDQSSQFTLNATHSGQRQSGKCSPPLHMHKCHLSQPSGHVNVSPIAPPPPASALPSVTKTGVSFEAIGGWVVKRVQYLLVLPEDVVEVRRVLQVVLLHQQLHLDLVVHVVHVHRAMTATQKFPIKLTAKRSASLDGDCNREIPVKLIHEWTTGPLKVKLFCCSCTWIW